MPCPGPIGCANKLPFVWNMLVPFGSIWLLAGTPFNQLISLWVAPPEESSLHSNYLEPPNGFPETPPGPPIFGVNPWQDSRAASVAIVARRAC